MRYDIISDTHGYLSDALIDELKGADYIVHAGDMCSVSDYQLLCEIAPVHMCLGNNDWTNEYGPGVERMVRFFSGGLRWQICHHEERLDLATCDIAICGHTHRPFVSTKRPHAKLVMNPGSPSLPRSGGPSMGRIFAEDGKIFSAEIIELEDSRWW